MQAFSPITAVYSHRIHRIELLIALLQSPKITAFFYYLNHEGTGDPAEILMRCLALQWTIFLFLLFLVGTFVMDYLIENKKK